MCTDPAILHRIELEAGLSNCIVLSQEDFALAKLIIQDSERRLVELEAEIKRTKSRLERLRVAVAPHKAVPPEVLSKIFQSTVIRDQRYQPSQCMARSDYDPWTLRQICSPWRAIICSDPSLWNVVTVDSEDSETLNCDSITFWMDNIVHPSFPLSLDISSHNFPWSHAILDLLIKPYSPRISHLAIEAFTEFFALPMNTFPTLQSIELRIYRDCFNPSWRYPVFDSPPCFVGMKNLRSLKVTSGNHSISLSQFETVPWGQLTTLKLESLSRSGELHLAIALEILGRCRHLEECRLHPVTIGGETRVNHIGVHLPRLTSLSIDETCNQDVSLLDFLTTPSLTGLRLDRQDVSAASVASLVLRSGCALHRLYISRSIRDVKINQLTEANLDALSSLRILRARSVILSNKTIEGIAGGIFLPKIESLLFSSDGRGAVQSLTNLIERRAMATHSHHLPPIQSISIDIRQGLSGDSREDVIDCLGRAKACRVRMTVIGSSFHLSSEKDL